MITIFKTGEFDYKDEGLDKPVKFDVDDLKAIASSTSTIKITDEHSKNVLGELKNFVVEDNVLKSDIPDGIDFKGYGFSPVYDCELVDYGDYYKPSNINLTEIGLTKTPRSKILYNSISEGEQMGESALEKVIREKDELQKKIGVFENGEKQYKRLLKQKDEEIEKIKESYSDTEKLIEENKALKEKADAYDSMLDNRKSDLIKEIIGDDDKLADEFEGFSVPELESVLKLKKVSTVKKGVTPEDYPVDPGNHSNPEGDDEYTDEMFEADFAASGL